MCQQGPKYVFTISGGYCYIVTDTKAVTCIKPQVTLKQVVGTCTLKYTSPTTTFVSHSLLGNHVHALPELCRQQ